MPPLFLSGIRVLFFLLHPIVMMASVRQDRNIRFMGMSMPAKIGRMDAGRRDVLMIGQMRMLDSFACGAIIQINVHAV
jgi:hypothetical protein